MVCTDAAGGAPGCCPALMDLGESGLPPTVTRSWYRDQVRPNIRMGKFRVGSSHAAPSTELPLVVHPACWLRLPRPRFIKGSCRPEAEPGHDPSRARCER